MMPACQPGARPPHGGSISPISAPARSNNHSATAFLAGIHTKLWRKDSPDAITAELRRAGVSRGMTAERFMAIRVVAPVLEVLAGFTLADGGRKIVLGLVFAFAGIFHFAVSC